MSHWSFGQSNIHADCGPIYGRTHQLYSISLIDKEFPNSFYCIFYDNIWPNSLYLTGLPNIHYTPYNILHLSKHRGKHSLKQQWTSSAWIKRKHTLSGIEKTCYHIILKDNEIRITQKQSIENDKTPQKEYIFILQEKIKSEILIPF